MTKTTIDNFSSARIIADSNIPGAAWNEVPVSCSHLPGIINSYYHEELVAIRQQTAKLIEYQKNEARARLRNRNYVQPGSEWYTIEKGRPKRSSEWIGVD